MKLFFLIQKAVNFHVSPDFLLNIPGWGELNSHFLLHLRLILMGFLVKIASGPSRLLGQGEPLFDPFFWVSCLFFSTFPFPCRFSSHFHRFWTPFWSKNGPKIIQKWIQHGSLYSTPFLDRFFIQKLMTHQPPQLVKSIKTYWFF